MNKIIKNNKQDSNKQKSATGGKEKKLSTRTKVIIGVFSFVLFIVLMALGGFAWNLYQNSAEETVQVESKWDSDAKLIDDRLNENDPIFIIVSPTMIDGYQCATSIIIYNNGYKVTELLKFDSYDDFMEQLNKNNAFVEDARMYYEVFSESENTHTESQDIKPSSIRDIYLKQYLIDDFSLKTTIDMTNSQNNTIVYIYGVTYDENLEPSSHLYYGSTDGTTINIVSDSAQSFFGDFTRFYSDSISSTQ